VSDTLGDMKDRIADELARFDLTSQIANAINDAVSAYEDERFFFNETRAITFSSVSGQEFYDGSDNTLLDALQKIDYIILYMNNTPFKLRAEVPSIMELNSQNGLLQGPPLSYCYYAQSIRFYPVPNNDTWTFRVGASIKIAAPASDIEVGNPWMMRTGAERLIRSRAKLELSLHVLKDEEMAQTMATAVNEAYNQLMGRTAQLTQIGQGRVMPMDF